MPLVASLHAYRLAHKTYWTLTRKAVLKHAKQEEAIVSLTTLSDFWLELFDMVGGALTEAHAVEEKLITAQSARMHVALIEDLLGGVIPKDTEAQRICALCGIRPGEHMAVIVARVISVDGTQVDFEVKLRSLARLIEQSLPASAFGKLVDIRNSEVTGVISSDSDTARRALQALQGIGAKKHAASGLAAAVGISLDATDIGRLPQALEEARLAFNFATAARPVMQFGDIELPEFLIRNAGHAAFRLIPGWARHFSGDDEKTRDLQHTIRAFADSSFNVKQTARLLGLHTNTVYFRLNRINELTGIDPRTYSGTSQLLTALRLLERNGNENGTWHPGRPDAGSDAQSAMNAAPRAGGAKDRRNGARRASRSGRPSVQRTTE
ncbi:MAG TPA: helix-turn-helix domain-containing protein [Burkholderiales bacterium]|nr:helix-turn-helix domain-containing protein [Burkholderiales bacterium]